MQESLAINVKIVIFCIPVGISRLVPFFSAFFIIASVAYF